MKIDRVILCLNNNPNYTKFWNVVAPVWKNKFNITPTLIFNGSEQELYQSGIDKTLGDILIVDKINEVSESNPDWSVTWSLFWGSSQFEDDICMLSGIDQIPISHKFFEILLSFENNKFIVGFSDAYKNYDLNTLGYFNTQTNVMYPSSHLVGQGGKFKEIFSLEDRWKDEIMKVFDSKKNYYLKNKFYPGKLWGLDECYSSEKISVYPKQNEIVYLEIFWSWFQPNRIDLSGNINSNYSLDLVYNGWYSELTCKPYDTNKSKIDEIINHISPINN